MVDSHNPVYFRHKSIRLAEYDYASEGGYFITIVTYHRRPLFGRIVDDEMVLNDFGKIIKKEWFKTSKIRPSIELLDDEFVVMPNHIHGIIWITDRCRGTLHLSPCNGSGVHKSRQRAAVQHTGTQQRASTETYEQFGNPVSNSIPTIIRLFKATTTKQINLLRNTPGEPVWQRNYYEHIIRSERDYEEIANYIYCNPAGWENDAEFSSSS